MNPDSKPSPAEAALKEALQTERPEGTPSREERHNRLQKAVRFETATHDVGRFVLGTVFVAIGKVLHALWQLVTGAADSSDQNANSAKPDRDERHP